MYTRIKAHSNNVHAHFSKCHVSGLQSVEMTAVEVSSPHEPCVEDQLSGRGPAMAEGVALHHCAIFKNQVSGLSLHATQWNQITKLTYILFFSAGHTL